MADVKPNQIKHEEVIKHEDHIKPEEGDARVKLLKQIAGNEFRLAISRVPLKAKAEFIDLANDQFAGDYGLTLKFLLDQSYEYQVMKQRLIDLGSIEARLSSLEESVTMLQAVKEKPARTLSGDVIHKGN